MYLQVQKSWNDPIFDINEALVQSVGALIAASGSQCPLTTLLDYCAQTIKKSRLVSIYYLFNIKILIS